MLKSTYANQVKSLFKSGNLAVRRIKRSSIPSCDQPIIICNPLSEESVIVGRVDAETKSISCLNTGQEFPIGRIPRYFKVFALK